MNDSTCSTSGSFASGSDVSPGKTRPAGRIGVNTRPAAQPRPGRGEAIAVVVDVRRATDVRRMVEEAIKRFGRVDVLYNHVGIHRPGPVAELDEADWDAVLATNLKSV